MTHRKLHIDAEWRAEIDQGLVIEIPDDLPDAEVEQFVTLVCDELEPPDFYEGFWDFDLRNIDARVKGTLPGPKDPGHGQLAMDGSEVVLPSE